MQHGLHSVSYTHLDVYKRQQQEIAEEKGIQIETEIEENVEGYADETMFIRLWMNLIGNAVTYGREGGWIRVGIQKQDNKVAGYVEDNGIGIEEEKLPHIWERFYQADTSRSEKGSGLGPVSYTHLGTISLTEYNLDDIEIFYSEEELEEALTVLGDSLDTEAVSYTHLPCILRAKEI